MRRFSLLLSNEIKLTRTTLPIHFIAIIQPALMFSLMAYVLITPTFKMNVQKPTIPEGEGLVEAMGEVGSPIGEAYIQPIILDWDPHDPIPGGQIVGLDAVRGVPTGTQYFNVIDSNMVKNFRNRLTAAALLLWESNLKSAAIELKEKPMLPRDVSYHVYFGMAMLPLAAFIGASFVAAFLTAQEFEFKTILEYRLAPAPWSLVIGVRLLRLCLTGAISAGILGVLIYLFDRTGPSSLVLAGLLILLMSLIGASVGTAAGLILRSTLPAFVISLALAFFTWLVGGAFGLPAGFGGAYEMVSRWVPNTYAVKSLFNLYYPLAGAVSEMALLPLGIFVAAAVLLVLLVYRRVVLHVKGRG